MKTEIMHSKAWLGISTIFNMLKRWPAFQGKIDNTTETCRQNT